MIALNGAAVGIDPGDRIGEHPIAVDVAGPDIGAVVVQQVVVLLCRCAGEPDAIAAAALLVVDLVAAVA